MALSFNGTTDYLDASSAPVDSPPVTMACWFRQQSSSSNFQPLIDLSKSSPGRFLVLAVGQTPYVHCFAYDGTSYGISTSTSMFTLGAWHHAACVIESPTMRHAYLDGGHKGTHSLSVTVSGLDHTMFGRSLFPFPSDLFHGDIAEAAVWNAALTDEEIARLATGLSPLCLSGRLPNLVLYQDLIRPVDRPGIGPTFSAVGSPVAARHPRMAYPTALSVGVRRRPILEYYRAASGAASGCNALTGAAAVRGALAGTSYPIGEVAN